MYSRCRLTLCLITIQIMRHLFIREIDDRSFYALIRFSAASVEKDGSEPVRLLTPVLTPLTCESVQCFSIFTPKSKERRER